MEIKQIVLTEKCNLNCGYCYMQQRDNMMSEETFMDIYDGFDSDYQIDLFGGEPLINWDLIMFIVEKCESDDRCKGINLYSNGLLLTQDKVDYILSHKVNFVWSYDGIWADSKVNPATLELVKQLTNFVAVQVGPPNLNMTTNYAYFVD